MFSTQCVQQYIITKRITINTIIQINSFQRTMISNKAIIIVRTLIYIVI